MLKQIIIHNFIFIEKAVIEFEKGFNVITGETGAGKSIFLNALNITLGNKISTDLIQVDKDFLEVVSVFDIETNNLVKIKLKKNGLPFDDNVLILKREITQYSKSKCYVNGVYVGIQTLKEVSSSLIDIHSQHQNQTLLQEKNHLLFYDQMLDLEHERVKYQKQYSDYLKLKEKREQLQKKKRENRKGKRFYSIHYF